MAKVGAGAKPARMTDVARLAGVSVQTVSRVVNDQPNVTPAVRERVQTAMEQLRYRRNRAARSLVTQRSMSIGVVCYGLAQHGPSEALTGIVASAREAGYTTNLVALGAVDGASLRAAVTHLVDDRVDGIVLLAPVEEAARATRGLQSDVPVVVFEPGGSPGPATFAADEVRGARMATEHLLGLGHATVLHLSGPAGWLATEARARGWREALTMAGSPTPEPIPTRWDAASGYESAAAVAARTEVTAVFVANDQTALGLMRGLRDHGVRVPDDVAVVGFDDHPQSAYFNPALTTVRVDFPALGRLAVDKVLALVGGIPAEVPTESLAVPELLVRASSGPPPVRPRGSIPGPSIDRPEHDPTQR